MGARRPRRQSSCPGHTRSWCTMRRAVNKDCPFHLVSGEQSSTSRLVTRVSYSLPGLEEKPWQWRKDCRVGLERALTGASTRRWPKKKGIQEDNGRVHNSRTWAFIQSTPWARLPTQTRQVDVDPGGTYRTFIDKQGWDTEKGGGRYSRLDVGDLTSSQIHFTTE